MIHYFAPGHEGAVLNQSPYYHPPVNIRKMEEDLAFLPFWYAQSGDAVWVESQVSASFKEFYDGLNRLDVSIVNEQNIDVYLASGGNSQVELWGVSPRGIHYFDQVAQHNQISLKLPGWSTKLVELTHRVTAARILNSIVAEFSFLDKNLIPQFYTNIDEVEQVLRLSPQCRWLSKAPFSSSGRGLLRLNTMLNQSERQILSGILKKQGSVSLERMVKRTIDFAAEFRLNREGQCSFEGFSLFNTNNKGQYNSSLLYPQSLIIDILSKHIPISSIQQVIQRLLRLIESTYAPHYKGYLGVDMMVYDTPEGSALHPCVEINLRATMGVLGLQLYKNYIHANSRGTFFVSYHAKATKAMEFHTEMLNVHPPIFADGAMQKGYFPLAPVEKHTHFVAYALLEDCILPQGHDKVCSCRG